MDKDLKEIILFAVAIVGFSVVALVIAQFILAIVFKSPFYFQVIY